MPVKSNTIMHIKQWYKIKKNNTIKDKMTVVQREYKITADRPQFVEIFAAARCAVYRSNHFSPSGRKN